MKQIIELKKLKEALDQCLNEILDNRVKSFVTILQCDNDGNYIYKIKK